MQDKLKNWYVVFILLVISLISQAQQLNIDSLQQLLKQDIHDTTKAKALGNLGHAYMRKGDLKNAEVYANRGLELSTKIDFKSGIGAAYNTLGNIYGEKGR
ncbi:MAG: tetratricopeptide repeat protein [Sphingobacteriaceae bacterium]|nr:tetratricopeptide repeat protein [Sphingobacteriaceae bacterium]